MQRTTRLLFVASVWLFIALNAWRIYSLAGGAGRVLEAYPGGYGVRVLIGPVFLIALQLFLWFRLYRDSRYPARILAGIIGAYILLMYVFVNVVVADLYARDVSPALIWAYACTGAGHMVYAFFGKEHGH